MAKISVADIAKHAKKIRKDGEKWTDAIKRSSKELNPGGAEKKAAAKKSAPAAKKPRKRFEV